MDAVEILRGADSSGGDVRESGDGDWGDMKSDTERIGNVKNFEEKFFELNYKKGIVGEPNKLKDSDDVRTWISNMEYLYDFYKFDNKEGKFFTNSIFTVGELNIDGNEAIKMDSIT